MLDRLLDFLIQFIELFRFWAVIKQYEAGVLLRLGKFVRTVECGIHWRIPFGVDEYITDYIVPMTYSLGNESVTTADGRSIGFHAVVTSRVRDIQKAILEIHDVDHAVRDACSGEIGRVLRESTWQEVLAPDILDRLTSACRRRGFRYGIEILSVQLAGLTLCKTLRLMSNRE
jgi:regulator of protease activity HflC (stomatin/prohibitin superfamily)